ncbi:glycoside hydrolase 15 protein, partial [Blyttiomyces sp. JEL0837]
MKVSNPILTLFIASFLSLLVPISLAAIPNPGASGPNVVLSDYIYNSTSQTFSGDIWVKNLAYTKNVDVFYSTPSGTWNTAYDISASYSSSEANNYEIWSFSCVGTVAGVGSQFYIKYVVNKSSTIYYDNNSTKNYVISDINTNPGANGANIVLRTYKFDQSSSTLSGQIWVKNLAYTKVVNVFYSTTSVVWNGANYVNASYVSSDTNNYELWAFSVSTQLIGSGSQFYLKYYVGGNAYYDSNS